MGQEAVMKDFVSWNENNRDIDNVSRALSGKKIRLEENKDGSEEALSVILYRCLLSPLRMCHCARYIRQVPFLGSFR